MDAIEFQPPIINPLLPRQAFRVWTRRLLACNPFYLISAACLLYGLYRLTIDPAFQKAEIGPLVAIFGSLQVYELLLVATAIFLARRRIWYDAVLLVALENLLVLVPFLLVTLAAYLGGSTAGVVCVTGAILAIVKFLSLKRCLPRLNLPHRLLILGGLVLAVNLGAPFFFRAVHDRSAAALAEYTRLGWVVGLPLLLALVNSLRRPRQRAEVAIEQGWLPLFFAATWLTVGAVHLWCIGYMYDLEWDLGLVAPLLWVLAWTAWNRLADFGRRPSAAWGELFVWLPVLAAGLGAVGEHTSYIVFWLTLANVGLYALLALTRQDQPSWEPLLVSLAMMIAALPAEVGWFLLPDHYSRPLLLAGAGVGYVLIRSAISRDPRWALLGALATAAAVGALFAGRSDDGFHFAVQGSLVFLLVHSLRWRDGEQPFSDGLRALAALGWVLHAAIWVWGAGDWTASLTTAGLAVMVLGLSAVVASAAEQRWRVVTPAAALLVLLITPVEQLVLGLSRTPAGLLAIGVAFVLFGIGTAIAVSRRRPALAPVLGHVAETTR